MVANGVLELVKVSHLASAMPLVPILGSLKTTKKDVNMALHALNTCLLDMVTRVEVTVAMDDAPTVAPEGTLATLCLTAPDGDTTNA